MSEDNVYSTYLIPDELNILKSEYEYENWEPAIEAYVKRTGELYQTAREIVIGCLNALDSGEEIICISE